MINPQAYELGATRSCIRELYEYGRRRAAQVGEENVFDFSLGNPSIPAPAQVQRTLIRLLEQTPSLLLHGYTTAVGDLQARQAICRELNRRYGAQAQPEELFLGCGAAPELCAVFRALAVPGGRVVTFAPYFPEYLPFAQAAGLQLDTVALKAPDFDICLQALEPYLTENTQAVLINSPHNPTGRVFSAESLQALAELLKQKSRQLGKPIYLISDEPYRELVYDGVAAPFLPAIYPDTVVCYSYSKSLSLPGERIGYVYVPGSCADSRQLYTAICGAARSLGHVCAPALFQKLLIHCAHLQPDLQTYDRNRRALYEGLLAAGYRVLPPQGAFYLWVQAPGGDDLAFSRFAQSRDVLLVPGQGFGCKGWLRLCYCVDEDMILRSLPVFAQLLVEYKREICYN